MPPSACQWWATRTFRRVTAGNTHVGFQEATLDNLCDWSLSGHRKNSYSKCSTAIILRGLVPGNVFFSRNESKRLCIRCNCRDEQSFWYHCYLRKKAGCVPVQHCRSAELHECQAFGMSCVRCLSAVWLGSRLARNEPLVASAISSGSALP